MEQSKTALTPTEYIERTAYGVQEAEQALDAAKRVLREAKQQHHKALDIGKKKKGENHGSDAQSR